MGIHVTLIAVHDARLLDDGLAVEQSYLDSVFPRLYFEREASGVVRRRSLTLVGLDVDHFNLATCDRAGAFRPANGAAYRSGSFSRPRAGIDDRHALTTSPDAKGDPQQEPGRNCPSMRGSKVTS